MPTFWPAVFCDMLKEADYMFQLCYFKVPYMRVM